jgi:hypothetical protein
MATHGTYYSSIWSPDGTTYISDLSDFVSLECVLAEMQIGVITLTLPPSHDPTMYQRDSRVVVYRTPPQELASTITQRLGNTVWLLRRARRIVTRDLKESIQITCVHPNALLAARIVAYNEETAQAKKTAAADDMIKAVVRENFVSATDTARNWTSGLFAVEADAGAAPSVSKAFAHRTVLGVLQEIAAAGTAAGTYTGFEVVGMETTAFTLRTYIGQRGADRGLSSGQPLVLGVQYRSMNEVTLDENWMDMASYVYAGGGGRQDEQVVGTASDAALIAQSPYGRIEWWQNATQTNDIAILNSEAARALRERRPRQLFEGSVNDTEYATFGEEYDWGDRIVGEYARPGYFGLIDKRQFDCRVDPVRIRVDRTENQETGMIDETETLDIRLRSES